MLSQHRRKLYFVCSFDRMPSRISHGRTLDSDFYPVSLSSVNIFLFTYPASVLAKKLTT